MNLYEFFGGIYIGVGLVLTAQHLAVWGLDLWMIVPALFAGAGVALIQAGRERE